MYANSVRPSAQSFDLPSRTQHALPSPSADTVVKSVTEMPLLPSHLDFTEPPGLTDDKTLGAMGQSSIYSTAKSKAQHTKAAVQEAVQRVEDVSTLKASDGTEVQITPQEQDLNAAGTLIEVAREQHPISPAQNLENLLVKKGGASYANASTQYTRKCPVISCTYHLDRGFWSKTEKDNHRLTHFEGYIGLVTDENRYSLLPWPNFIEDPENFFHKIEILKRRVGQEFYWYGYGGDFIGLTCYMCLRNFDLSGYVKHLDDCIVHAVQAQALGTAPTCPVSTCEHDPPDFPWRSHTNEPTVKHFVPTLGCSRCYTIRCQCPPTQQEKANSSDDGFLRLSQTFE